MSAGGTVEMNIHGENLCPRYRSNYSVMSMEGTGIKDMTVAEGLCERRRYGGD